jgi:hypothetical protein
LYARYGRRDFTLDALGDRVTQLNREPLDERTK